MFFQLKIGAWCMYKFASYVALSRKWLCPCHTNRHYVMPRISSLIWILLWGGGGKVSFTKGMKKSPSSGRTHYSYIFHIHMQNNRGRKGMTSHIHDRVANLYLFSSTFYLCSLWKLILFLSFVQSSSNLHFVFIYILYIYIDIVKCAIWIFEYK